MFKFLRRYNKLLLAVFGGILMVIFLIPQAITRLSQQAARSGATIATVGDAEEVSNTEWQQVQEEMLFMQRTGITVQGLGPIDEPAHWYLLTREARQAGLIGQSVLGTLTNDQIQTFARVGQVNPAFVDRAFSRITGVNTLIRLFRNAGKFSDYRLRHEAERLLHSVQAQLVIIDAQPDRSTLRPAEEALQTQFEAYADILAGEGDFGFGYRMPDRAKIEWIDIDASDLRALVEQDEEALSGIALRRHWKEFALRDGLPLVETGVAVPEVVRTHLLDQLTEAKRREIARWATDELQTARRGMPQRGGYYELPEEWSSQRLSLSDLAESLRDKYAGLSLPGYHSTGNRWYSPTELTELGSVARATTDKFGVPATLINIVAAAQEFDVVSTIFAQQDVAVPALVDLGGTIYIARIIDTDPSRRPASLDEVRDDVTADLRRLDAFEQLKDGLNSITATAQTSGLLTLAIEYDTVVQPQSPISLINPFSQSLLPVPAALPVLGVNEQASRTIIDHALTLPRVRELRNVPETQRTLAFALDDRLSVVVARIESQSPLSKSLYELLVTSQQVQGLVSADELDQDSITSNFGFDALAARHQFAFTSRSTDEEDDVASTQTASADTTDE